MKRVLITGATGVLGSALTPLYFQDKETTLTILLRADSQGHLNQRLNNLFAFWGLDRADCPLITRIEAVSGDMSLPRCGLANQVYDRLGHEVTHIIHSAGNVKLNRSLADARRSAVDSAQNIVDLVRTCQRQGQFRKLELVSTVGVAGRTRGLIQEQPFAAPREFHNTYEAGKAEAESLVWGHLSDGLPGTVHRPSMIVGDSNTGKNITFQVFYYLTDFLVGLRTYGIVPETHDAKLDIIPVDYVAMAIYLSSDSDETCGRVLHLCSGPDRSWTLKQLTLQLRTMLQCRGRQLPRLHRVPSRVFRLSSAALSRVLPAKQRRFLRNLPLFLDYLDEIQLFDNSETNALLSAKGLVVPGIEQYLEPVMGAYWEAQHR